MALWTWLNPLNWFRRRRASAPAGLPHTVTADLYGGDIHPVVDIEGIGPAFETKLSALGILNTDQLLAHDADAIAALVDTPAKRVRSWQSMAELAQVDGIGPQYAEALVRGGVDGISDLVARDAKVIANEVTEHLAGLKTTVTGGTVSERRVSTWQRNARGMKRRKTTVTLGGTALAPTAKQAVKDAGGNGSTGRTTATVTTTPAKTATTRKAPAKKAATTKTAPKTKAPARKTTAKAAPKTTATATPCAALTAKGEACSNASRPGSKYCGRHKGYRAPATTAKTTKAPAKKTATTGSTTTKPAKSATKPATKSTPKTTKAAPKTKAPAPATTTERKTHYSHNGYKLYQKGNRFYFSKKAQTDLAKDGAVPVYALPKDREVKVTQNGLPVLKAK